MTVFLTTHYMEEAAGADDIIVLDKGSIAAKGTPFELKEQYVTDRLRLYFDSEKEEALSDIVEDVLKKEKIKGSVRMADSGIMEVSVPTTMDAVPLICSVRQYLDGFEVIQGTMDDVFLNAVGHGTQAGDMEKHVSNKKGCE